MTTFQVVVQLETTRVVEVQTEDLDEAIAMALATVRAEDPAAQPTIASVLDPDDETGNAMPLQEWFAD